MKAREHDIMARAVQAGVDTGLFNAFRNFDEDVQINEQVELDRVISIISSDVLRAIQLQFDFEGE